ncbi:4Fe-4S binding protein [Chitinispirillales bacterium ANBcel5]|uniref:4Fe-4S binding protein n=1 Tax=Cellulosispirillum alkaliphilum TaxID=3039283 RepID=UPI002A50A9CB|nr:4Fe-4S binding protein [Chitinispirillales bacterium ANBcel5]
MFHEHFPKMIGPLYVLFGTVGLFLLLKKGRLNKTTRISVLIFSAVLGFVAFTPMFPVQFQQLLLRSTPEGMPPIAVAFVLLLLVLSSLVVGRIFCGYLCPIGAVQELVYMTPVKKVTIRKKVLVVIGIFAFTAFLITAIVLGIALLQWFGITPFFQLQIVEPFFYVFAVVVLISIFFYRPFCRMICPLGLMKSCVSRYSFFRISTGSGCSKCKICEKQCPTETAIIAADRCGECYLCLRCAEKCSRGEVVFRAK